MHRALALAFLVACSSSKADDPKSTPATSKPAEPVLAIAPSELTFFAKDQKGLMVSKDGRVQVSADHNGTPLTVDIGTVKPDGSFVKWDGTTIGRFKPPHTYELDDVRGKKMQLQLEEAAVVANGSRFAFDAKGNLLVDGKPDPDDHTRVEGAADATAKRTALVVMLTFLGLGSEVFEHARAIPTK